MKASILLPVIASFCMEVYGGALDGYPEPHLKNTYKSAVMPVDATKRGVQEKRDSAGYYESMAAPFIANNKKTLKNNGLKLNKTPFKYQFSAAGTDESGYVCGRLVITNEKTGEEIGVYDYKSLIDEKRISAKPFWITLKKRGSLKEEKWLIDSPRDSKTLIITIPASGFVDIVTGPNINNTSDNEKINASEIIDIRGEGQGHHTYLPPVDKSNMPTGRFIINN